MSADTFGGGLSAVVCVSVAIALFEGGSHLRVETPRESPAALVCLVAVGAAITWLGTAAAVIDFLDDLSS